MKITELRIDGYKNLSKCKIPMRDFNVVVGPNNSGKSNLLETFWCLWGLCFGPEEDRVRFFRGSPFPQPGGRRAMTFLDEELSPLQVGISFETEVDGEAWKVDYDLSVGPSPDEGIAGFRMETLAAKKPSTTGPAKKYIIRQGKQLRVADKDHQIPEQTSALSAMAVLYADSNGMPDELSRFASDILSVAKTKVYLLSPEALRAGIYGEPHSPGVRVSSFDLLETLDKVFQRKEKADIFQETVLHILDLRKIHFAAKDIRFPAKRKEEEKRTRRFRFCVIRGQCGDWHDLSQYSDGTLIVLALVASLVLDDPTDSLTCIEELENCLHPSAQQRLLRFLIDNSKQWQLLVTTHSPYLVNGVSPEDVAVAVVGENGQTHFKRTTDIRKINELLKSGMLSFGELMATNFQQVL